MGFAAFHDCIEERGREISQHGLFQRVVGELVHNALVFFHFVKNCPGVVKHIILSQVCGVEYLNQTWYALRQEVNFPVFTGGDFGHGVLWLGNVSRCFGRIF